MVSNTLGMENEELIARLKRLGEEFAGDAEYQDLRSGLPAEWPF